MASGRRSLNAALAMTPDAMAFIKGAEAPVAEVTPVPKIEPAPVVQATQPQIVGPEPTGSPQPQTVRTKPNRRTKRLAESEFEDSSMMGMANLLVPLTTRLQPKTAMALKRAGLEQKLRGRKPSTVQEIVEEAVQQWLDDTGYLE